MDSVSQHLWWNIFTSVEVIMKKSLLVIGFLAQSTFADASSLSNEKCWSSKPILKATEESKKVATENELCAMDFYTGPLSICPKLNSTFPGVLVIKRPTDMTDSDFKKEYCTNLEAAKDSKIAKVEAKFKQTTSCSHASSPVAYYRFAEFLGDIKVPVAVFRTMDKAKHLEVTKTANAFLIGKNDLIAKTWRRFLTLHANPSQFPDVFQNGVVFGALSENIKGEHKFNEITGLGDYDTGYERFMKQPAFLAIASSESVVNLAGGADLKSMAQIVTTMEDVSNMVLIDYLLNQADRMVNVHYKHKLYKLENGNVLDSKSEADVDETTGQTHIPADEQLRINAGEVLVREIILKDNDCGVSKENKMRRLGILERVRHMNAKSYRQALKLAAVINTEQGLNYLRTELRLPLNIINGDTTVTGIKSNILKAAKIIKANCENGTLKLDLNLEKLLADPNYRESCSAEEPTK